MLNLILACTKNFGIGLKNNLPWKCKSELALFKNYTMNSILIMGRKTVESLPTLPNREIICITSKTQLDTKHPNAITLVKTIDEALAISLNSDKKVFVAGGASIYSQFLTEYSTKIKNIFISVMKSDYECDSYISRQLFDNWVISHSIPYEEFTNYTLTYKKNNEQNYLDLLKSVVETAKPRIGRNGTVYSSFVEHLKFDLREGFPLFTTRKMFFRGIVEELLFFIRGETNSKILENKNINIWKGNTSSQFISDNGLSYPEGLMGPMYGYQWRNFNAQYDPQTGKPLGTGVDQLFNVIDALKNNPESRRILLTDFNPAQANDGVLYPCHSIIMQFYVEDGYLDCFCYNRSSDLFHGLAFNIPSTALFMTLLGKITNLKCRYLNLSLGDAHIYESHVSCVKKQLMRIPFHSPKLCINKKLETIRDIEKLEYKDFVLSEYTSHPGIKVDMVV